MKMRSLAILSSLLLISAVTAVRAGVPAVLEEALEKDRGEEGRWAFTETQEVRDGKGALKQSLVIRCDPSKPYAEQYTAVSEDGKTPSKKMVRECRERGEKEAAEREKAARESAELEEGQIAIDVGGEKGFVDLNLAAPTNENEQMITYKVPARARSASKFPFDRIDARILVDKRSHSLDGIRMAIRTPFRASWMTKVKGAELSADYGPAGDGFPPQASRIEVRASVSVLLVRLGGRIVVVRSDFKRVKPYDERFSVRTGPLRTLGF